MTRPAFLITVDTEGDNLWSRPRTVTTENARFLPRFQSLCESYGLRPVYLTNWEMARDPVFREFGCDVIARGTGEIGMHLHAWDSPPAFTLTADDTRYQPYLVEYPDDQIHEKVRVMTATLEDAFGVKMVSHRAGRWAMDERYARVLVENGYLVDCSVTPHVSWRHHPGDPTRTGGADYTAFPEHAYFLDLDDISRPGSSPLLELPLTIIPYSYRAPSATLHSTLSIHPFTARVANRLFPTHTQLTGTQRSLARLRRTLSVALREQRPYVEFAIHSSELMPGGSPTFPTAASIENLYATLDALFAEAATTFTGASLATYRQTVSPYCQDAISLPDGDNLSMRAAE